MEAFISSYTEVYKDLYKIAYYYMGNKSEAEDAVGDAVLKAYENYNSLRNKDAYKPWITKILINTCKSRMRRWFKKNVDTDEIDISYEQDLTTKPALEAAMKILNDEERLIIALYVFGGYKGEEISKLMKMNHSTVRSKYNRALLKMKRELED